MCCRIIVVWCGERWNLAAKDASRSKFQGWFWGTGTHGKQDQRAAIEQVCGKVQNECSVVLWQIRWVLLRGRRLVVPVATRRRATTCRLIATHQRHPPTTRSTSPSAQPTVSRQKEKAAAAQAGQSTNHIWRPTWGCFHRRCSRDVFKHHPSRSRRRRPSSSARQSTDTVAEVQGHPGLTSMGGPSFSSAWDLRRRRAATTAALLSWCLHRPQSTGYQSSFVAIHGLTLIVSYSAVADPWECILIYAQIKRENIWSETFQINFGVKQESMLSPRLFALYII